MLHRSLNRVVFTLTAAVFLSCGSIVRAQGVLHSPETSMRLPRPTPGSGPAPIPMSTYRVKTLAVEAKVRDQAAEVQVSQTFVNTGSRVMEVQFLFPLPADGAVDRLTLLVDGQELVAELMNAKDARGKYDAIVRSTRDPALLEWAGQGLLKTSVFPIPPGAERTVVLRYHQLLKRQRDLTDMLYPLASAKFTSQAIESVSLRIALETTAPLKTVYSPTHAVDIRRPDDRHAVVTYSKKQDVPSGDFRLFFDSSQAGLQASVLTYRPKADEDGYFLMLASPPLTVNESERLPKSVVFVVDKSGSMSGAKIQQARGAAKFVLENLREGDLFNIVAYETSVEMFRPEMERFSDEHRKAGLGYIEGLLAGGGTNIAGGLGAAFKQLNDSSRPSFVLFLTDGIPTVGERNELRLAELAKQLNSVRARMLTFGVGYDLNSRLLDRLARENFGASDFVLPEENIEEAVSRVFRRISDPVLTDVKIDFAFDVPTETGPVAKQVYPKQVNDLFAGDQIVMLGRYRPAGDGKIVIRGRSNGQNRDFTFVMPTVEKSVDQSNAFIERLWALRRVGEIIDAIDLHGSNQELVNEMVALATKHGILTQYTSFLAEESGASAPQRVNAARAFDSFRGLQDAEGRGGVEQRSSKEGLQNAGDGLQRRMRDLSASELGKSLPAGAAGSPSPVARQPNSSIAPALTSKPGAAPQSSAPASGPVTGTRQPAMRAKGADSFDEKAPATLPQAVRYVGDQAIYKVGRVARVPELREYDVAKNEAQVSKVKRFSDEYFVLLRDTNELDNRLLAAQLDDEDLLISLNGKLYLILAD